MNWRRGFGRAGAVFVGTLIVLALYRLAVQGTHALVATYQFVSENWELSLGIAAAASVVIWVLAGFRTEKAE